MPLPDLSRLLHFALMLPETLMARCLMPDDADAAVIDYYHAVISIIFLSLSPLFSLSFRLSDAA